MITSTTFKNIAIRAKIMGAMRRAMVRKCPQPIYNRKGYGFMMVERVPGNITRCFRFITIKGVDVTETVYKGLK